MKKLLLKSITISFLCLLTSQTYSQGFQINSVYSAQNGYMFCDSIVDLSFSAEQYPTNSGADIDLLIDGDNFQASQFQITINWGDGTTTSHIGGVSLEGIPVSLNPAPSHTYSSTGTQIIIAQVTNPQNGTSAFYTIQATISACLAYIYTSVSVDCNNDGTTEYFINQGVPLIFTSGNNQFSDTTFNNMIDFSGMPLGTYLISVDPTWLNANGFIATIMPQTMIVSGPTTTFTTQIVLICQPTPPDTQCISGFVFCDANENGIFDTGELPISNAPISIQTNTGITINATSNGNGYYSVTYNAPNQTPAVISINPNWLTQNGYSVNQYIVTTIQTDCNLQNPPVNFAITNCSSPQPNQGCISGFVWCDSNGDGDFDSNEVPLAGAPITLQGSVNNVTVYSDSTGFFLYCGTMLNMTTVLGTIDQNWLTTHGYSISNPTHVMIFMPNLNLQPVGFGVNCGSTPTTCADLWTTVTPWIGYFQNQTNLIRLNYGNYGPGAPGNYTVTLTFPAGVTPVLSSISNPNYVIAGNTITWTLTSSSTAFSFNDVISFNTPMGIPSGTQHLFVSTISPTASVSDCNSTNNSNTLLQIVGNSYDPNDKTVDLQENIDPALQEELTYIIRFQNTGTAPAQDVYIIDTLSANLDWNSLTVIETTHTMHIIDLGNGVIRFDFPQIWLPDSTTNEPLSHGHVVFKIKEMESNVEGSQIYNTGYIYFDWNPAIITNTTYNINSSLGITEHFMEEITLYPNPTSDLINIRIKSEIKSIQLTDMTGQILQQHTENTIDLSAYPSGIYFVRINTSESDQVFRIVKK